MQKKNCFGWEDTIWFTQNSMLKALMTSTVLATTLECFLKNSTKDVSFWSHRVSPPSRSYLHSPSLLLHLFSSRSLSSKSLLHYGILENISCMTWSFFVSKIFFMIWLWYVWSSCYSVKPWHSSKTLVFVDNYRALDLYLALLRNSTTQNSTSFIFFFLLLFELYSILFLSLTFVQK